MEKLLQKSLIDLLNEMQDPRKQTLITIYTDFKDLFHTAQGSSYNHQAWFGGYADHIAECLRINDAVYDVLNSIRPLDFKKDSATIALFLHDIEKPFRYGPKEDSRCSIWQEKFGTDYNAWEHAKWEIIAELDKKYGLQLQQDEINALKYTHGEGDDHKKNQRVATPLAAHVHHCDNTSARIWYNQGQGLAAHKKDHTLVNISPIFKLG